MAQTSALSDFRPRPARAVPARPRPWSSEVSDTLWAMSLNLAACRRWLACSPPRLDEASRSLCALAALVQEISDAAGAGDLGSVETRTFF